MTPNIAVADGAYVDLVKEAGDLDIRLSARGRIEFADIEAIRDTLGTHEALYRLLEDHLANGWEMVQPEEIGALTSAPILSDEIERNEEGKITSADRVYWYPSYQVSDVIAELRAQGMVLFTGVS